MPSKSKKQHNLMAAVANNPKFAKKVGIPQSVGEDYVEADKGRKFNEGGLMKKSSCGTKKMKAGGKTTGKTKKFAVGGYTDFMPATLGAGLTMGGDSAGASGSVKQISKAAQKAANQLGQASAAIGGGGIGVGGGIGGIGGVGGGGKSPLDTILGQQTGTASSIGSGANDGGFGFKKGGKKDAKQEQETTQPDGSGGE